MTVLGTSHGPGIGCIIDGCPAGLDVSEEIIQRELDLRKPSEGIGTNRKEEDKAEVLSGIVDSKTTGAPIAILIRNKDVDSSKYEIFRRIPRPGHADYPALVKFGESHDLRGGGQFSGRMTAPIVSAGAVAKSMLAQIGVRVVAYSRAIGSVVDDREYTFEELLTETRRNPVRAGDPSVAKRMRSEILAAKKAGDSVGGIVKCIATGLPVGVGEPFFDTMEGELSKMMFAIPAVKGIEFGAGFKAARMKGSEHNDPFAIFDDRIVTKTNNAGGILGGLTNGMPLEFNLAFKPTASISLEQGSVDLWKMKSTKLRIEGRHDPCIVPRAVVVVEGATAFVLADLCKRGGFIV